jgi:hypothetical protein
MDQERLAARARIQAEEAEQETAMRARMAAQIDGRVTGAAGLLTSLAKAQLREDRGLLRTLTEAFNDFAAPLGHSGPLLTQFQTRVQQAWDTGPGASLERDHGISSGDKALVGAFIRNLLRGLAARPTS